MATFLLTCGTNSRTFGRGRTSHPPSKKKRTSCANRCVFFKIMPRNSLSRWVTASLSLPSGVAVLLCQLGTRFWASMGYGLRVPRAVRCRKLTKKRANRSFVASSTYCLGVSQSFRCTLYACQGGSCSNGQLERILVHGQR